MQRRTLIGGAVLLPTWAGCAHGIGDAALAARVDALLEPLAAANEFNGAVVLSRRGRTVYARGLGFADHEARRPFTPETPSDGGSLAKTFTAAGVQWLVHEGRLALDAPVAQLLPQYPHPGTTVHDLIAHSNGLPPYYEWFDPHFKPDDVRTTQALLARVAQHQPQPGFAPGTRFEYSNLGYDAAALVIERVTGQGYEAFVTERFLRPLGMHSSFARPARLAEWRGPRARGVRWRDGAWQAADISDNEAFLGASNLWFSARDLARWADAWAAGRAVPSAVAAASRVPPRIGAHASAIDSASWFGDAGRRRAWYTGAVSGFRCLAYWDRERHEALAWVSNSSLPDASSLGLSRDLVDALAGAPQRPRPTATFERFDRQTRALAAGRYRAEGLGVIDLAARGTALSLRIDGALEYGVFQVARHTFYVPGLDWNLAFSGGATPSMLHLRSVIAQADAPRLS
jgi:CubicO group peptidase (beta-lactamase class C family)